MLVDTSSRLSVMNSSLESFMKRSHVIMPFCRCGREKLLGRWREYTRQQYLVVYIENRHIKCVVCSYRLLIELHHQFVMIHLHCCSLSS